MSSTIRRYFLYRRLTNWPPKVCWSMATDYIPLIEE